jgi:dolichol-phosphate mannosyltransferase
MMLGIKLRDCTSGFRCYSREYIRDVINNLHSQTFEIQIETVKQAWIGEFRVGKVLIVFSDRKREKSKLTKGEFKDFLAYTIKTKFGVTILLENKNAEADVFSNVPNMDERTKRLIDL